MTNSILTRCSALLALCLASLFLCADAFAQRQASGTTIPLFSWWSPDQEDNFATSDPRWGMTLTEARAEKHRITNGPARGGYRLYRLEGMIFDPERVQPSGTVPLYSWWNATRGDNFATTDPAWTGSFRGKQTTSEHLQNGPSREGYTLYRLEGYLFDPNKPQPAGTVPVYSWWNAERSDNFLTTSPDWDKGFGQRVTPQVQRQRSKDGYTLYRLEGFIMTGDALSGTQDTPSTLKAKVATTHGYDFSRAAVDIEDQFGDRDDQLNMKDRGLRFRMHGADTGAVSPHFQGIGFLRDTTVMVDGTAEPYRRSVLSYNYGDGLLISGAKRSAGSVDGVLEFDEERRVRFQDQKVHLDIMRTPSMGNHKHPGGLQTHGDLIAIGMEQPVESGRAAVYFIEVDGMTPRFLSSLELGTGGAPGGLDIDSAAASGFVKLTQGFLVAVSGAKHGTKGIWFYKTLDNQIDAQTNWTFVDFWGPERMPNGVCNIKDGKHSKDCYVGAGGGISLIANDDGRIYTIVTTGTDGAGKDDEYSQLYEVIIPNQAGFARVELRPVWSGKKKLGNIAMRQYSMRWAGAAQTTLDGRVLLLNSERGEKKRGARGATDGVVRIAPQRN